MGVVCPPCKPFYLGGWVGGGEQGRGGVGGVIRMLRGLVFPQEVECSGGDKKVVLQMPSLARVDCWPSANMHYCARQRILHCFCWCVSQHSFQQCEQALQCRLIGFSTGVAHEGNRWMMKAHFEVCAYCSTEDGKGVAWGWAQTQNAPRPHQQGPDVQRALALGGHIVLVVPY